ncbi:hypothetical protein LA5095_03147 [Roseibium album]|nr:hypothetical protein LA5095_03147 [Roseibium album]
MTDLVEDRLQRVVVVGRRSPRPGACNIHIARRNCTAAVVAVVGPGTGGIVAEEEIDFRRVCRSRFFEINAKRRFEQLEGLTHQNLAFFGNAIAVGGKTGEVVMENAIVGVGSGCSKIVGQCPFRIGNIQSLVRPVTAGQIVCHISQRRRRGSRSSRAQTRFRIRIERHAAFFPGTTSRAWAGLIVQDNAVVTNRWGKGFENRCRAVAFPRLRSLLSGTGIMTGVFGSAPRFSYRGICVRSRRLVAFTVRVRFAIKE